MCKLLLIILTLFHCAAYTQTPLHLLLSKKTGGAPPFSPTDISGLRLWVKADQITGLIDGDPVTTWSDQSGNSNDLAQSTAGSKPTYKTNIQNSKPVVRLDGGDFLEKASPTGLDGGTGMTIFIAVKYPASADNTFLAKWDYQTQGSWAWQSKTGDGQNMLMYIANAVNDAGGNNQSSTGASLLNQWYIIAVVYDGSQATNGNRVAFYKNGSATSVSTAGTLSTSLTSSTATLKMGKFGGSLTRYLTGDIGECLIYDSALSGGDITSVFTYLNARWAVY